MQSLRLQDLVLDTLSIYTIRLLSADMVDKAGDGLSCRSKAGDANWSPPEPR